MIVVGWREGSGGGGGDDVRDDEAESGEAKKAGSGS